MFVRYMICQFRYYHVNSIGFKMTFKSGPIGLQKVTNTPWTKCYGRFYKVFLFCRTQSRHSLHTNGILQGSLKNKKVKPILPKNESIRIWKNITVSQFAKSASKSIDDIFEAMLFVDNANYDHKNSKIDDMKILHNIAKRLGRTCLIVSDPGIPEDKVSGNKDIIKQPPPDPKDLVKRPPVVTIMGHVDHGKTTLLDSLRNTSVVSEEFGGITQHIGAFSVKLSNGESITFLDTPGHAAFSAMRARGAHATDIVVLVVAADDGVMEQTIQSMSYAREAKVPIIVAINKIDKPESDIEYTMKSLMENGIQLEEKGGEVQAVKISALKGTNLEELIDSILALTEVLEIRSSPKGFVEGLVLESKSDIGRGKLATVLIQRGTLKKGAYIVAGTAWAKVRSMFDEWGKPLTEVKPGMPAQVIGWRELPGAGEEIYEVNSEREAKEVIDWRKSEETKKKMEDAMPLIEEKQQEHLKIYKEDLDRRKASGIMWRKKKYSPRQKQFKESDHPHYNIIIKGDVDGSVEAILDIIDTYHLHEQCNLDVIHYGVGTITPNDIDMAEAFDGTIYGFNIKTLPDVKKAASQKNVNIKDFKVIYKLVDDLKEQISSKLPLTDKEEIIGEANMLQEFIVNEGKKKIPVAGCRCTKGQLKKSAIFRVLREQEVIHEGPLESMKHLKNEVDSIKKDVECGLRLKDTEVRFLPGDLLVCYEIIKVKQQTTWNPGF